MAASLAVGAVVTNAGCAALAKRGATTQEVIQRGVDALGQGVSGALSGNWFAAGKAVWDYAAWLVGGGATVTAGALGVKVRKLTRRWNPVRDGERRKRRVPPRDPTDPPPLPISTPIDPESSAASIVGVERRQAGRRAA